MKHAQVQQVWPDLTADSMETLLANKEDLDRFAESLTEPEIQGRLYVWCSQDGTRHTLSLHPVSSQ